MKHGPGGKIIHVDNHYVPRLYLKRWANHSAEVWTYRLLVSHERVPLWRRHSYGSLAYHEHLYVRHVAGGESDEVEKWLDREFEQPADRAIEKVVSGTRMLPEDWAHLARFVAAQDVRTPARLIQMVAGWQKTLPELVENTLRNSVRELMAARKEGRAPTSRSHPFVHEFPARVTTEIEAGAEHGKLRLETIPGRALWLFSLRHLLTETVAVLVRHRWTILRPPRGFTWLTSDNPVIRLNYYKPGHYDFEGGWGRDGCELLLPLSPEHLLYTKIGDRPLGKERISEELAKLIQRMTIEHAHRFVFGVDADPIVERIRPRKVDAVVFKEEIQFWKRWHEEQGEAERNLVRGRPPN